MESNCVQWRVSILFMDRQDLLGSFVTIELPICPSQLGVLIFHWLNMYGILKVEQFGITFYVKKRLASPDIECSSCLALNYPRRSKAMQMEIWQLSFSLTKVDLWNWYDREQIGIFLIIMAL